MSATRRQFLHRLAGFGSAAICLWIEGPEAAARCVPRFLHGAERFIPNEPKVTARLSAAELEAPEHRVRLARLREAVCKIQGRKMDDRSTDDRQGSDAFGLCAPANADAGAIQHSGEFLPWHRALLYIYERTLRRMSGDDDLRLVYWDWESLSGRAVPAVYTEADQCLFHSDRDYRGVDMKEIDVSPMLAAPDYRILGGGAVGNSGAVFGGPEASVLNAFGGDLGSLRDAPRDPLFFAHQANIDRLWSSWVEAGHSNPDFGAGRIYFYDEDDKPRYMLFNDLKDESRLGYRYSTLMPPKVRLKEMKTEALTRQGVVYAASKAAMEDILTRETEASYLIIAGIRNLRQLPRETRVYGVFAGRPNLGWLHQMDANYLGKVSDVRGGHERGFPTCILDVSERLAGSLRRQKGMLHLVLAPINAEGKIAGAGVPLLADKVTVLR